jgi:hypothetical protein
VKFERTVELKIIATAKASMNVAAEVDPNLS